MLANNKYTHNTVCGNIVGVFPIDSNESRLYYERARATARACSPIGKVDWFGASRTIPYVRLWQDKIYGTYYAKDMRDILFHKENDSDNTFILSDIAYYFWALNENKWKDIVNGILSTNPNIHEVDAWNMAREAIINQEMANYMVIPYKAALERANNDPAQVMRVNEQYSKIGYRDMYIRVSDIGKMNRNTNAMQNVSPEVQALANKIKELSAKFGRRHKHGSGCSCGHDHHHHGSECNCGHHDDDHSNSHQDAAMGTDNTQVALNSVLTDKYYSTPYVQDDKVGMENMSFDKLITPTMNATDMPDMSKPLTGYIGPIGNYHPNAYGNYNYDSNSYAQQYQWQNQQRLYQEQQMRAYQQFMNPNVGATQMPTPPPAPGFGGFNPSPLFPNTPPVQNTQPKQSKFADVKSKSDALDRFLDNNPGYTKKDNGDETLDLGKMFGSFPKAKKNDEPQNADLVNAVKGLASTMKNGNNVVADVENKMKEDSMNQIPTPPPVTTPMMGFNPLFRADSNMQNMYQQEDSKNADGSYRYPDYCKGYKPGDEFLIPTREEIESGERFYAWAEVNGVSTFDPTLKLPKYNNKAVKKKPFEVCLMKLDENGQELFSGENEEFVEETKKKYYEEKKKQAAIDYKDAAVMIQDMDRETELYLLISTMKKYNQYIADKLAFMKDDASVSPEDFADMLDNTLVLLESYQKKDPLASVKSPGVRVENKKLIIDKNTKNVQDAMKRVMHIYDIRNKKYSDIKTAMKETGLSAAEINTIMKYSPVNPSDIMSGKVSPEYQGTKVQNDIFSQFQFAQNNEPLSEEAEKINESLITKLQCMTNIRVVNTEEEYKEVKDWESKVFQLNPYQEDRKSKYLFWKARMRNGDNKKLSDEDYNKWFDKWWNSPTANYANGGYYTGYYNMANMSRKEKTRMESDRRTLRLTYASMMSPYVQEQQSNMIKGIMANVMASRNALEGCHTLNDLVYGPGISRITAANIHEQYVKQVNKVRRRFSAPILYNNMMNGTYATPSFRATPQQYDVLMHSDKYNDRRQKFINKIFSKEEMRPTNKRYSYE